MFRSKLRNARLEALFPHFDLRARKPTSYQLRLDRMTDELRPNRRHRSLERKRM
jgi:hypothetical protein